MDFSPRIVHGPGHISTPTVDPEGNIEGGHIPILDTGCGFFPACLSCPVPECFFWEKSQRPFTARVAPVLKQCWETQEADRPLLFKAARVLLSGNPKRAAKTLGPEFMEVLDAYERTQGCG